MDMKVLQITCYVEVVKALQWFMSEGSCTVGVCIALHCVSLSFTLDVTYKAVFP